MKKTICILVLAITAITINAQTTEDSVKATINNMFTAMKTSNGAALQACFADSALLQTISRNKEGKTIVRNEAIEDFVKQVASMPANAADERIVFEGIKIDGPMATAWTPYNFYFNGKFSHCGVNNFVLVKQDNGWKIQYIIDTRRRQGCKE
jgi:hypothetical protein